jgi:hypothetical protein
MCLGAGDKTMVVTSTCVLEHGSHECVCLGAGDKSIVVTSACVLAQVTRALWSRVRVSWSMAVTST